MTDYKTVHAACLDADVIPSGPGDLIISLRLPLVLQGPEPDLAMLLETGTILMVDVGVACVRETALNHYCGTVRLSELRFALARMLDLLVVGAVKLRSRHEPQIDDWITEHTLFSWRIHDRLPYLAETRTGWFNGVRDAWDAAQVRADT